jgi:hypothetical protein
VHLAVWGRPAGVITLTGVRVFDPVHESVDHAIEAASLRAACALPSRQREVSAPVRR